MKTVDRKIYAYNFTAQRDLHQLFNQYLSKLGNNLSDLKKRGLLYTPTDNKYSYFMNLDKTIKKRADDNSDFIIFKGTIYQMRSNELPIILNTLTGLTKGLNLSIGDGLAEITHYIFIPSLNLILSEYNHTGSRIEKIRSILDYTLNLNSYDLDITPILRKDNYKTVVNCGDLKEIYFKLGHLGYSSLNDAINFNIFDDLSDNFNELSNFDIELKITAKRSKHLEPNNKTKLLENLSQLAKKIMTSKENSTYSNDSIKKISLRHYEGSSIVPLDLLEDKLVQITKVTKLNDEYKYVDSDDMFNKLIELYQNNIFKIDRFVKIIE